MKKSLQDQRVVIVGGTSGMGLAAANQFAQAGAEVIVASRSLDKLQNSETEKSIRAVSVDASSAEQLSGFFEGIGRIDHLIITLSGSRGAGPFRQLGMDELHAGFDQKFWPHFQTALIGVKYLRPDGSLTFISGASARSALPGTSGLAAINGAIEAMVKPLARELSPLRVNAISPGVVVTPWWNNVPEAARAEIFEQAAKSSLVGRNGSAQELGEAIVFVVENGFVTGTVLEVDGGIRMT